MQWILIPAYGHVVIRNNEDVNLQGTDLNILVNWLPDQSQLIYKHKAEGILSSHKSILTTQRSFGMTCGTFWFICYLWTYLYYRINLHQSLKYCTCLHESIIISYPVYYLSTATIHWGWSSNINWEYPPHLNLENNEFQFHI